MTDVKNMKPGDAVIFTDRTAFESPVTDKEFVISGKMLYCLCVGRVASATVSGLSLLKVYLLTPVGVGYKRFNFGGDKKPDRNRTYRRW